MEEWSGLKLELAGAEQLAPNAGRWTNSHTRRINHTFLPCAETFRAPVSGGKPWISKQQRSFKRQHKPELAERMLAEKALGCGTSDERKVERKVCIFEPTEADAFGGNTNTNTHTQTRKSCHSTDEFCTASDVLF